MSLTRSQRRARAAARVADARRNPGRSVAAPVVAGVRLDENPNRAKRHLAANVRDPRETMRAAPGSGRQGTTGVTGYVADPRYVARYDAATVTARAERNVRTGETVGSATVEYRNRRRVPNR